MLTNSDSQYPVEFWLKWLKDDMHFRPRTIMIDNSDTEIAGIRSAYGEDMQVAICHWHLKRAWRKNIASKVCIRPGVSTHSGLVKVMRDETFNRLNDMVIASTEEDFELAYDELQLFCLEHEEEWDMTALQVYFDREYLPKKTKWSNAWRQVSFICNKCDLLTLRI